VQIGSGVNRDSRSVHARKLAARVTGAVVLALVALAVTLFALGWAPYDRCLDRAQKENRIVRAGMAAELKGLSVESMGHSSDCSSDTGSDPYLSIRLASDAAMATVVEHFQKSGWQILEREHDEAKLIYVGLRKKYGSEYLMLSVVYRPSVDRPSRIMLHASLG
jgi:hypothetical protein